MNKTMTHTPKRNEVYKLKKLGAKIVTFFTVAFLVLTPAVASAAELTAYGVPYGYGNGYKNVLQGKDAFQRLFKVGSSTVPVYSTSFKGSVPTEPSLRFQAVTRSKSGLSNLAKAADVAARASSIGTPLSDVNSEAVAVQLAVWRFLEGTDIKPVGQINVPILQRAEELIEKASAVNTPERAVSVDLKVTQDKLTDGTRVTVTLSASGKPLAGEYVTVKAGTKTLRVLTNDAGVALAKLPRFSSATTMKASFNWSLPAGTVLVPPAGASVITGKASTIVSTASTKIAGTAAAGAAPKPTPAKATPTPTPTPTPTASATPTPSPTEAMLTGDFEDPAADVIDVVPEQEVATEDDGLPGWVPLVGVAVLFLIALGIARQRLNG